MKTDIKEVFARRVAKLNKIKTDDKLYQACLVHYASSAQGAVDFINDWMMTFDPRVTPSNLPFLLYPKQEELIKWLHGKWSKRNDGLVEKTRDCGLTWLACAFSVWLYIFHEGQSISWGSRKESLVDDIGNADSIFEKIRIILRQLPKMFRPKGYDETLNARFMKFTNPVNGSTITGEAGDNIGRGGRSSIYFKDESAFYERPIKIEAALSQNSDVKIDISTPNGNGNPFYKKRFGGVIDVFTFNWRDDPRKTQAWYDEQCRVLDPVIVAQEIDIDYDASVENALIPADDVDRAQRTRPDELDDLKQPVILGVDPARFGSDSTAIVCRQGRIVHFSHVYKQKRNTEIAGYVSEIIRTVSRPVKAVFIDEGGLGAGVVDILHDQYDFIYGVQFGGKSTTTEASDKRSEMWLTMREWLEGTVSLPSEDNFKTDLCSLQYKFNAMGQYVLEKKEDAKKRGVKSPDVADALALTFARPVLNFHQPYVDIRHNTQNDDTGY
jgi:hypothetical protein